MLSTHYDSDLASYLLMQALQQQGLGPNQFPCAVQERRRRPSTSAQLQTRRRERKRGMQQGSAAAARRGNGAAAEGAAAAAAEEAVAISVDGTDANTAKCCDTMKISAQGGMQVCGLNSSWACEWRRLTMFLILRSRINCFCCIN